MAGTGVQASEVFIMSLCERALNDSHDFRFMWVMTVAYAVLFCDLKKPRTRVALAVRYRG